MKITLNGTSQALASNKLADIVGSFCKVPKHVIAELNGNIIPAGQWDDTLLKEGDTLELVTFVGGG